MSDCGVLRPSNLESASHWSSQKPSCLDTGSYRTLLLVQFMLNLNGWQNLRMPVVVNGIFGLCGFGGEHNLVLRRLNAGLKLRKS